MERRLPVKMFKRLSSLFLVSALVLANAASVQKRELVLVAGSASPAGGLSIHDIRKLYLGVPVENNGVTLKPLVNASDPLLFEVFLQKVTFMSSEAYDKQVLAIVFRLGGERPPSYRDRATLYRNLREHPDAVTFAWRSDLQDVAEIKPIGVLWAGEID